MQMRQPVPTYFGRYQVLEELGSGAMGVVYLCVDPRLARPVAVKVIRESEHMTPAEKTQFLARFRNEAEAAGRLNHPGIVQIYDIGPSYLVMEYLDGKALSTILKAGQAYTVQEVCSIVLQVADAVDYAHKHGIVHRDIKPANIMMMDDGGVKVMDFGVARLESSTLTVAGTVVGSVRYMAPEQMMGEQVDARADVFSLGAVGYEMLTGRAPFPGKTITEVVGQVVHGHYVPPRQVDERLPDALGNVFGGAFAVRPDDRYPSAMDFARDLYIASEPVLDLQIGEDPDPAGAAEVRTTLMAPNATPPATTITRSVRAPGEGTDGGREGLILVDSDPRGAEVFLDGKPVGTTPVEGAEVSFGRHVLRIEARGRGPVSAEGPELHAAAGANGRGASPRTVRRLRARRHAAGAALRPDPRLPTRGAGEGDGRLTGGGDLDRREGPGHGRRHPGIRGRDARRRRPGGGHLLDVQAGVRRRHAGLGADDPAAPVPALRRTETFRGWRGPGRSLRPTSSRRTRRLPPPCSASTSPALPPRGRWPGPGTLGRRRRSRCKSRDRCRACPRPRTPPRPSWGGCSRRDRPRRKPCLSY
jgi:predicted Ser/Thr protein kinase